MNLQAAYSREDFLNFVKDLLPNFQVDIRKGDKSNLKITNELVYLGESKELKLTVFELIHTSSSDARVALSNDGFRILKNHGFSRALIAYRPVEGDDWRFSLLTATLGSDDQGQVTQKFSNPRRFSFFLGPNAKINTPTKFLINKGSVADFEDLKSRFSLEVVNKEFYKEIAESFTKLVGGTRGEGRNKKTYESILKLPSVNDHSQISIEFAVRLIGRIIFCWFLKEKVGKNDSTLMPKELLSMDAVSNNQDYYHQVLEPIFFEVLNKPIKSRKDPYSTEPFSLIPYLNGGLFSPHGDDFFSYSEGKREQYHNTLVIPDEWVRIFFGILETYNFTIDENTSIDEELSIDPEMLGRVFENLLAEINPETGESARKSTGSYYTPRTIVNYMVDESLLLYLKEQTGIQEEKLRAIISYNLSDDLSYPINEDEKKELVDAIEKVKILDPACGSGAFPIGALQKIVFILQQIDPDGQIWFQKQIQNTAPEMKRIIEREFAYKNFDYLRKLGVIRENIYGIDIQPIATEISRLRCFLTIIVDQRIDDSLENRGIEPLPNLDFKFVSANSLIGLPKISERATQEGLFEDLSNIDQLKEVRDSYFGSNGLEREQLKTEFEQIQKKMFKHMLDMKLTSNLTHMLSSWEPFSHKSTEWFDSEWMFGIKDGFDIVIVNPPYVRQEQISNKQELKKEFGEGNLQNVFSGRGDLYIYFYARAINILKEKGVLAFISSDKFISRGYAEKLRNLLASSVRINSLIDFGEYPIFAATIETCVLVGQKQNVTREKSEFMFCEILTQNDLVNVVDSIKTKGWSIDQSRLGKDEWILANILEYEIINKLKANSIPLGSYVDNQIFAGIKTGRNNIFVINEKLYQRFLKEDPRNKEILKPWLEGSDIENWGINWGGKYIIFSKHGIDITKYPSILDYLEQFRHDLEERVTVGQHKWYELQQPQMGIYKYFSSPKIIYQNVSRRYKFAYDDRGFYPDLNILFIPSTDLFLLGIISSSVVQYFAHIITNTKPGGFLILRTMYVENFPIPDGNIKEKEQVVTLVKKLIDKSQSVESKQLLKRELDNIVYHLFKLSTKQISIMSDFLHEDNAAHYENKL